jgi:hypothetical protein
MTWWSPTKCHVQTNYKYELSWAWNISSNVNKVFPLCLEKITGVPQLPVIQLSYAEFGHLYTAGEQTFQAVAHWCSKTEFQTVFYVY